MAENKTKPTNQPVADYISQIEPLKKRQQSNQLIDLMQKITGTPPIMWGTSIIGFGQYSYKYQSGHSGTSFLVGFAPRKSEFSIYLMGNIPEQSALLEKLGKHRMGRACLYVRDLEKIDMQILEKLVHLSVVAMKETYPDS